MKHLKSVPSALIVLALGALPSSVMAQAAAPADAAPTTTPTTTPATEATATDQVAPTPEEEAVPAAPAVTSAPAAPTPAAPTTTAPPADPASPPPAHTASEDESQADDAQAAAEPLAWRNSFFTWTQGVTLRTFDRTGTAFPGQGNAAGVYTYNPTYYHYFFLNPRWYIDPHTFLVLGAGGYVEATQDDGSSVGAHEFQLGDMSVELRRSIAWEGFIFLPSLRIGLPLSKASQASQRIANTGLGLTVVRPIPEAAGMTIAAAASYRHWWASSNIVQSPDGLCTGDCSALNEQDRITAGVTINVTPIEHLTVSVGAFFFWINSYASAAASTGAVTSSGNDVLTDLSPNHWRNRTSYSLSVAYDPLEWLNVSLGWSNSTFVGGLYAPNGEVRNPFLDPDQQITLNLQMTLDTFYSELTHPTGEHDDGLTPEERQRRRQGLGSNDQNTPTRSTRF